MYTLCTVKRNVATPNTVRHSLKSLCDFYRRYLFQIVWALHRLFSLGLPARCSPHTQGLRRALGTGAGLGFVETVNLLTGLTALTALTDMKSVRHATIVYADMASDGGRVAVLRAEVYRARDRKSVV